MEYPPPNNGHRPGSERNGHGPAGNGRGPGSNGAGQDGNGRRPAVPGPQNPLNDTPPPTEQVVAQSGRTSAPPSTAAPSSIPPSAMTSISPTVPVVDDRFDPERRSPREPATTPRPSAETRQRDGQGGNGSSAPSTPQGGRKARAEGARAEILKDLVVQAGMEVLDRDGLGLRAESITYAKVFAYIESEHGLKITRGSVHERIWASQEDFQLDVLTEAASLSSTTPPEGIPPSLLGPVVELVAELTAEEMDPDVRCAEFCRRHGHHFMEQQLSSESVRQFQALKAAARVSGDDPAARSLKDLISIRSEQLLTNRFQQLCFVFDALGFRGKRALGLSDADAVLLFAQLIQMLIAGTHLDRAAGITAVTEPVADDRTDAGFGAAAADDGTDRDADGAGHAPGDEPWTAFSIGMLAFAHLLFEPADSQPAPADSERLLDQVSRVVQATDDLPENDISYGGSSRRSREELRRLVMTAGVELLLRDGLGLAPESLTYASVFAHIREEAGITVHRSTVHGRVWNSQEEFRQDILAAAARYGSGEFFPRIRQALAATPEALNPDGSVNRYQTVLDTTLAASKAQSKLAASSRPFTRWQSIKAAMLTWPSGDDIGVVDDAFIESFEAIQSEFTQSFVSMFTAYGLQLDDGLGVSKEEATRILAVLTGTLAGGADFDSSGGVDNTHSPVALPRIDGRSGTDEWPPLAVGVRALWELLFAWNPHN